MTDPAFTLPPEPEAYQRLLDAIHKARAHAIATESPFSATNSQAVDNLRDLCRLQLKALESGLFPPTALESGLFPPTEPPAKPEPLTNADLNPSDIVRFRGKEWRVQGIDDENPYIGLLLLDVAEPKDSPDFHGTDFPITRGSNRRPKDGYNRRWRWARAEDVELVSRGEHVLSPGEPEARVGGEDCHCATCTCASGMTPAVRFDTSPVEREGAVRDHLIRMGWTPPQQPAAPSGEAVAPAEDIIERLEAERDRCDDLAASTGNSLTRQREARLANYFDWAVREIRRLATLAAQQQGGRADG